jgi:hypothetical protein
VKTLPSETVTSANDDDQHQLQSKRSLEEDTNDATSKKQKINDESEPINDESNQTVPSNVRFEWYDEIKLALSKANDRTLSLELLQKKVNEFDVNEYHILNVMCCRLDCQTLQEIEARSRKSE